MKLELLKKVNPDFKNSIIFVHGAYHAAWCWAEHFIEYFYDKGYNVVGFSFRNHAGSEKIDDINSIVIEDLVYDLKRVVDSIDGEKIIIAHSLGCRVVQMYLECQFHLIKALVLMTPMPVRNNIFQLMQIRIRQSKKPMDYILFSDRLLDDKKQEYMNLLEKESKKVEYSMINHQKKFNESIKNIPTLVIGSKNDQCVIMQSIIDNGNLHNAKIMIFEQICHDMMLDPQWYEVAHKIFQFLKCNIDN